jgi:flagellar protein FliO/FliZ
MGSEFLWMLLKVVIFLPGILGLIYLSLKYGGARLQDMQNGRFIKILERVPVSKENSLLVAKIGEKGYVMASTNGKLEILLELKDEELHKIETSKVALEAQYGSVKDLYDKLNRRKNKDE